MIIISGNLLKTLLLILMIITHISSLLLISYVLMSPYHGGMDRVVIGLIWVCRCMCKWTGRWIMGMIPRMLHAGGQVL